MLLGSASAVSVFSSIILQREGIAERARRKAARDDIRRDTENDPELAEVPVLPS
jgi:hypothetical protein